MSRVREILFTRDANDGTAGLVPPLKHGKVGLWQLAVATGELMLLGEDFCVHCLQTAGRCDLCVH